MIDLGKYTYAMYNGASINNKWRMNLKITSERKYDFVANTANKNLTESYFVPLLSGVSSRIDSGVKQVCGQCSII